MTLVDGLPPFSAVLLKNRYSLAFNESSPTAENRRKSQIYREDREGTVLTATKNINLRQNNRSLPPTKYSENLKLTMPKQFRHFTNTITIRKLWKGRQ